MNTDIEEIEEQYTEYNESVEEAPLCKPKAKRQHVKKERSQKQIEAFQRAAEKRILKNRKKKRSMQLIKH